MENTITKIIAILASRNVFTWNEDMTWRYLRDELPRADDQYLQQIADRIQLLYRQ